MSKRPKVLFLNSCVSGGGPGRGLALYLDEMGDEIEAHVVMPEPGVAADKFTKATIHYIPEFVERIRTPPYKWARKVPGLNAAMGIFALTVGQRKINRLVKELQPDVIYANHMLAKPLATIAGRAAGVPVVFHVRNIHDRYWPERRLYQMLAGDDSTKLVMCNSEASAKPLRVTADDKIHVVPNFVNLDKYQRSAVTPTLRDELGLPSDALVVGFVGRIVPWKGVDRLVEAFATVADKHPNAHVCVVGGNDPSQTRDLIAEYGELAKARGVGDRVHFLGFRDDIRACAADFDISVLPSVAPEPFGRVLIECMALGVPPVLHAHGGAVEVVADGEEGLWVEPNNVQDLGQKMSRLLGDNELRKRLGENAAAKAHREFGSRDLSRKMTDLMCEAIGWSDARRAA